MFSLKKQAMYFAVRWTVGLGITWLLWQWAPVAGLGYALLWAMTSELSFTAYLWAQARTDEITTQFINAIKE